MKRFIIIYSALFFIAVNILAQGKIILNEQANNLFGPVLISIPMETMVLKNLLPQSSGVLMFQIIDNELFILDVRRNVLLPVGSSANSTEVFSVYSETVLQELLTLGNLRTVYFEQRETVFTITIGLYTLEYGLKCPPFCPE